MIERCHFPSRRLSVEGGRQFPFTNDLTVLRWLGIPESPMQRTVFTACSGAGFCAIVLASPLAQGGEGVKSWPDTNSAPASKADSQAVLTTAEQVHQLTREAAARGQRAVIRGVVTCALPDSEAVVIQDTTRGIYVDQLGPSFDPPPQLGELLELEGITDPGEFAPQPRARSVNRLGAAELPQPIRPTWDQLINGSLDTQYVEMQGVVTSVRADGVTLLTR